MDCYPKPLGHVVTPYNLKSLGTRALEPESLITVAKTAPSHWGNNDALTNRLRRKAARDPDYDYPETPLEEGVILGTTYNEIYYYWSNFYVCTPHQQWIWRREIK